MSWLHLIFTIRPTIAATICPTTVATAAPATPIRGAPHSPKIRMGSMTMLMMAPNSWVHMARLVRPVDCSSRSKQNWLKIPTERPKQIRVYCTPYSTISGTALACAMKKGRERNRPMKAKTR